MKVETFIMNVIRKIESLKKGLIVYGYKYGNEDMTHTWYSICLSDYDMYMNNKRFKTLSNAWRKAGKALGIKVVFFYCNPVEENLKMLLEKDNLFFNV